VFIQIINIQTLDISTAAKTRVKTKNGPQNRLKKIFSFLTIKITRLFKNPALGRILEIY